MKIIITHDVDHIKPTEHILDFMLLKYLIRSSIEFSLGYISLFEVKNRFYEILFNKINYIEELIRFDKEKKIPSTFFLGVSKGRGLSYSTNDSKFYINMLIKEGFDVGIHGIAYNEYFKMNYEYKKFKEISNLDKFGIRIHGLKHNSKTFSTIESLGYIYDSSVYELRNPYRIGMLWEFPIIIMDAFIMNENGYYQSRNIKEAIILTKKIFEKGSREKLKYINVLFHDRYFNDSYYEWKEWYLWLVEYLNKMGYEVINIRDAIEELNNG